MNAYELADKLQMDKAKALLYVDTVVQSAEMLRQQADQIAELGKQTKSLSDEEIFNLTAWKKNPYELYVEMEKEDMVAFARAIEERHGIK